MQATLPVHLIKPRFLSEVPRSEFSNAPKLKSNDEKARRSFISLLRKGPTKQSDAEASQSRPSTPKMVEFNCAAWLHSNQSLNQPVSLMLHIKETNHEYLVVVDESNPDGGSSVMLSGCVTIQPKSPIEFVRACCSGISNKQSIHIEALHVKGEIPELDMRLFANG